MVRGRESFLVWGGGGHGKVVADLVRALGYGVIGFVDADPEKLGRVVEPGGARVVAGQEEMLAAAVEGGFPCGADSLALAVGDNTARQRLLGGLGDLPCPPLLHPRATASPSVHVGRGTVVFAGAVVNAAAWIGDAVVVNTGAIVEHDCRLGHGAHVSPGAVLAGGVRVGERSWIGASATVIQDVTIGSDAVVGAGAVVIRDVPDGATVVGVPARLVTRTPAS